MKLLCLVSILLASFNIAISQETYSGKVIDTEGQAVAFAHVFFNADQARGAITNELGEFKINVTEYNKVDSLVISILGYETLFVPYQDLIDKTQSIVLSPSSIQLGEVIILSDTYLRYILKEAIAAIPQNYPTEQHLTKAYYQEYTISDSTYAEMIEADVAVVSDGYNKKEVKQKVYLNKLRRTEDNRDLPDRLRTDRNMLLCALDRNTLFSRSFSKFGSGLNKDKSLEGFVRSVDFAKFLKVHSQQIQDGDTILTICISDPFLKVSNDTESSISSFGLVSVNLTNKAIIRVVYGDQWSEEADFEEVVYRKVNDLYYPSYMRSVRDFEYNKKTKKHYNSQSFFFYELVNGKDKIKKYDKGKKMKVEKGLRLIKKKTDTDFWENYAFANSLSAATIIRSKFGLNR